MGVGSQDQIGFMSVLIKAQCCRCLRIETNKWPPLSGFEEVVCPVSSNIPTQFPGVPDGCCFILRISLL